MQTLQTILIGALTAGVASASTHSNDDGTDATLSTPLPTATEVLVDPSSEGMLEESQLLSSVSTIFDDGDVKATWGGRIMNDAGFFSTDDMYPVAGLDGFEFRRARLFSKIKFYDLIEAKAEFDFTGGTAAFSDVYMKLPTPIGSVQFGHIKQPMSLEELTSSRFITFMERAAPIEAFSPSRDNGIATSGHIDESTNWAAGVFRLSNAQGLGTGDGDFATTGRISHAFGEGDSVTHIGVSASIRSGQEVRFRTRPEAHLVGRVLDTTAMPSDGSNIYGFEAAWVNGPVSVQGEYLMTSIDELGGAGGPDVDLSGYYAFVSWFLTGESRNYVKKSGKFDRVSPHENWNAEGTGGAWEAALRYSMTDFSEITGGGGGELTNITAGLNWYMNPRTRLMFNVVSSNLDDSSTGVDDDLTALMMRLQVDW